MKKYLYVAIVAVFAIAALAGYDYFRFNDGRLHIVFCDVGQGDAILITTPGKKRILVDAGPDRKVLSCLNKHMPFWERRIDLVLLSHPHADHYFGLYHILDQYKVGSFGTEALVNESRNYQHLMQLLSVKRISQHTLFAGYKVELDKDLFLTIEGPTAEFLRTNSPDGTIDESQNFGNLLPRITYGSFDILFTGDSQKEGLLEAVERIGKPVDVLQVPHHGSATGLDEGILDELRPSLLVVSVGKNSYGHPTQYILNLASKKQIKLLRTDKMGDIEITTDGKQERYQVKN